MKIIANRQLRGEYGSVIAGQQFDARDEIAIELMKSGMAHKADPPKVQYETKVIKPEAPEVSPREPFCDRIVPYEEPPTVAPESAPSISAADIPERGDADRRRRGRRPRSGS